MTHPYLISQPTIQVIPALAEEVGLNEAVALQTIHYWLNPKINQTIMDGCHWVENLASRLERYFLFWDREGIGHTVARLEQSGILTLRDGAAPDGSYISYHTIDYRWLGELIPGGALAPSSQHTPSQGISKGPKGMEANPQLPFKADIHHKGENLYVMVIEDRRHSLACDLTLEVQEIRGQAIPEGDGPTPPIKEVVCHFPNIDLGKFKQFVWEDETLFGTLLDEFQLKLMKQLLLFCLDHHAIRLVIFTDATEEADLDIYHEFLEQIGQTSRPPNTEGVELVIPANREAVDAWMSFMADVGVKLRQSLWRERKTNKAVRHYLQHYGWPEFG